MNLVLVRNTENIRMFGAGIGGLMKGEITLQIRGTAVPDLFYAP